MLASIPPALAQLPQDQAALGQAAYYFAIGAVAYGECSKLGYKVNPNGWHALVEHTAPGVTADDFVRGGKHEALSKAVFEYTGQIVENAGVTAWCAYIAAWAKAYHPRIWPDLITK
jgi:hypothetical protein